MFRKYLLRTVALVFVVSVFYVVLPVFGEINPKPVNTLTELGERTKLMCCSNSTDGKLEWKRGELSVTVCNSERCSSGYSVDKSTPGCFHLIISSTSFDEAGLYQCNEVGKTKVAGAYLVVYSFSCSSNFSNRDDLVEEDNLEFQCKVEWKGKLPFQVRWMDKDGTQVEENTFSDEKESYTSTFPIRIVRPSLPSYTADFSLLSEGITDENIDKGRPSVNWTSHSQLVMYPASKIKTSCPIKDCQRTVGDTIQCLAEGYPDPEVRWLDWSDKVVTSTPVLMLDNPGTHKYTCFSENTIRGKQHEDKKEVIVSVKEDISCLTNRVFITVAVLVTTVFVIVFLAPVLRDAWYSRQRNETARRSLNDKNGSEEETISLMTSAHSKTRKQQMTDTSATEAEILVKEFNIEVRPSKV